MNAARPSASPVIGIERLTKRFGDVVAVDDVSLDVARGEFFSLLGPSGCGKTTMLRLLAGFEAPTSGTIRLDGRDVSNVPPYRRPVNTVFQSYALFPHLTVYENVAFGPRMARISGVELDRRVRAMLDVVRLGDLAGRRPSQLSGGQRQRVALARALVNDPSALLLDEPLSALDLALRRQMQTELKRIQREVGITFVFVTHDQEEALALSDRIAVMRGGRVEQLGMPQVVYDAPATAFVARFIGIANLLPVAVDAVHGDVARVRLAGGAPLEVGLGAATLVPGAPAVCMIRPERVRVVASPPDGMVALAGTVTDLVFQGPVVRCVLRDDAGTEIVAHVEPAACGTQCALGSRCWAVWQTADARLLSPDATPDDASTAMSFPT